MLSETSSLHDVYKNYQGTINLAIACHEGLASTEEKKYESFRNNATYSNSQKEICN